MVCKVYFCSEFPVILESGGEKKMARNSLLFWKSGGEKKKANYEEVAITKLFAFQANAISIN